jgi:glycine betaine/proline transport system ATP-binding protein
MINSQNLTKVFGLPPRLAMELLNGSTDKQEAITQAGGVLAVNNVSFTVAPGELFVIMGLSGSGKSTLIRMINRLVEPTAGTAFFGEVDIATADHGALRKLRNERISMVFQHFALFPHQTIRDNAAYGLKIRGVSTSERLERADRVLRQVGLGHRGDAYPHELSGGMKQRVGLARALATDPEVLLMDEPFSALDPMIRRQMQSALLEMHRKLRKTILFVTHDLNEAMRLGDRIMVMRDGQAVQLGTGPEIISRPANDYVRDFVSDVDRTRVLTAEHIMQSPRVIATIDEKPSRVLARLEDLGTHCVYVTDASSRILGVARNDTLAQAVAQRRGDLTTCRLDEYRFVAPNTPVADFCHLVDNRAMPVAVVDEERRLLGVVDGAAIVSAIATRSDGGNHA